MMKANAKLKQARITRKIEQESLAHILGVSTATYGRWERGEIEPSLTNLRALCAFFGRPPEELGYMIYERPETQSATRRDQSREQML